ncbi:UDP-glucose 6-dehydrogenase tuaD [Cedecea neteri]|uniref:UDP-glucose 6-dehydrogenase n=1 Tax=Cedecea neteri TaxID=158822 RepID=A0A2X3J125_9ENTR|nr:UDP-glucose 6-dehydrogenase tuaD [Cedecea neteri]
MWTAVARTIAQYMDSHKVVIDKSTVPVGTADKVRAVMEETLKSRGLDINFDVVSNPEFLKEGAAVADCMRPERIVIGTDNEEVIDLLRELYEPFNRNHDRMILMDIRSAELTKYAANCMLATKISFMNEIANLAERLGADIEKVRMGIGSDFSYWLQLHLSRLRLRRFLFPERCSGADSHRRADWLHA